MLYESIKPGPGGSNSLMRTPLEGFERLEALIPPPRRHGYRHRCCGVLAPNASLRGQVTALAGVPDGTPAAAATESIAAAESIAATPAPSATPSRASEGTEEALAKAEATHRRAARTTWALLLARIHEVFPLACPRCGGEMRIIAFISDAGAVREILSRLGEPTSPPRLMRARARLLWEMQGAALGQDEAHPNRCRSTNSTSALPGRCQCARVGHAEIVYAVADGTVCSIGGNVRNRVEGNCRATSNPIFVAVGAVPPTAFAP